ncbi:MAG: PHP domain protein [Methanohalophilus sp. T328-1]|uniref:PHP domain-containing protein n=1 Tax=Methanohalophilus euhalobius TaxID=51203 RepID=A0A285EWL5_9EURY|nr:MULTISPECIES: PHP domain-containing protein [Methanohalophilus]KXS47020.1 MAG: PHP domain protein [Methanohalophilus sp. T328-1]RSD36080.1 MAG: PHP domain protein [Methanohalophilus sp.]OBZ35314.1 MAG: hypothetical protein A9957_07960 [Methanohalophilus sp. DAL1]ODV48995.1 MAG: PHP domain protein [Methanohalophilus sp. 2-GBenrich]RXG33956.1 PHP domain protein [Methanohalophilus sp. WG1-DM]
MTCIHILSIPRGTLSPDGLVKEASEVGLKSICLMDHDTLDSVLSVGDTTSRYGVEFILGMGIDVGNAKLKTVLAKMPGERFERAKEISSLMDLVMIRRKCCRVSR